MVDLSHPMFQADIPPSDDLAPPSMDDMRDFATSPQDAASELAASAGQSLEDFLTEEYEPQHTQDPFRQVRTNPWTQNF